MNPWEQWIDGDVAKIFYLGQGKATRCEVVASRRGFVRSDGICLGNLGQHLYVAIVDQFALTPEQAINSLIHLNCLPLPPHHSDRAITREHVDIFTEHGPDLGIEPGDTTKIVAEKVAQVRGFPPLRLTSSRGISASPAKTESIAEQANRVPNDTGSCLHHETKVNVRRGGEPLGVIELGQVQVGDELEGPEGWTTIVSCRAMEQSAFIRITFRSGSILCAPSHVLTALEAYGCKVNIAVEKLTLTYSLFLGDGSIAPLESIEVIRCADAKKISVTCEPHHHFYAGEDSVIVQCGVSK